MCPTGAQRESARHLKSSKIGHNCLPETQREKDHRKVQKSMRPEPLKHSFRIGGVMKINISLLPANIPKMLTKRLPKWSRNRYKCVYGRLRKNTPKVDAKKCNIFENASQNGPQHRFKIDEKTHLGILGHHWASLWHPWEGSGGTPRTKTLKNQPKTCFRARKLVEKRLRPKTFLRKLQSENLR